MNHLRILLLLIVLVGCDSSYDHPAFEYYASKSLLSEGYVSKYYQHYYPANPDQPASTEVVYTKFQLLEQGLLLSESFNAGFDLSGRALTRLEGPTFISEAAMEISREDTFEIEIVQPVQLNWQTLPESVYQLRYQYAGNSYLIQRKQIAMSDTLLEERKGKYFVQETQTIQEESGDVVRSQTDTTYYASGLGYYGSVSKNDDFRIEVELIEQMSIEEFKRRKNHGEHRVAWIDPEKALDQGGDFTICGHERFIADYYNSDPDGRYLHDKRAMLDTVFLNLDKSKLFSQSGRLVFRFVVNCEGKAGRFVAEGYNLDYQPMEFDPATVEHLYSILRKLEEWRPVVMNKEPTDAFFYITFNIENGKIVDILP